MTATDTLIAAGRVLAEPGRDLDALASEFRELGASLKAIGAGLDHALDCADGTHDQRIDALADHQLWNLAERREWTRDEVELAHRNELGRARDTAKRTAQKMLVELARLIGELEIG